MEHQQKNINFKNNVIWNSVGAIFFLACHWLITVLVVRLSKDYTNAGVLSLSTSIANIFAIIALFNVRNYQVSDSGEYSSGEYIIHRIVTCTAAFILCFLTVVIGSYGRFVSICILGFMVLKLTENFADVFHGIAQKSWRLDIAGKSFISRGSLIVISFTVGFILTDNLAIAIIAMALTNLASLILYDYTAIRKIESIDFNTSARRILDLSIICLPMVGYGLCIHSITPITKCLLEAFHGTENLGYYSSITTVASLIQSFSVIIFTPLIGLFAEYYEKNEKKRLTKLIIKLFAMISGVTVIAMLLVLLIGDFAMSLVFGEGIIPYVYLLYPTIVSSALTALVWLIGMVLVVMRYMKSLLIGAVAGLVTSVILALALIPSHVFDGTNIAVIGGFAVTGLIYLGRLIKYLSFDKAKNTINKETENGTENT